MPMERRWPLPMFFIVAASIECSSPDTGSRGGTATMACTPNTLQHCGCKGAGSQMCLADGTGWTACSAGDCAPSTTSSGGGCKAFSSMSCCGGDGDCCPCNQYFGCPTPSLASGSFDAFVSCICGNGVCDVSCKDECAHGAAYGPTCKSCVVGAEMKQCSKEYKACVNAI